ncbi:TPA: DUF1778 domain-containing protein [Vibrio parahaemolyticus]|nr:DUF1778 domain-containing protein [Vibrio parahaemolyticus]EJC7970398.1 DUF1778 domain-containing protein [Vibrio parahaemolyticus]ELA9213931.1 DUF1778 domain-containing protein [Vibrio parahaemolyticus]ELH3776930.1 DUF1778 domain-containing protein [Vibrio parahaemolyticus]HCG9125856.1 DUF1778 domain-containing protein [Vibrio parahaemolyticus]
MSSATMSEVTKMARLDLKTNQLVKSQLEEAAMLSGVNLTAFILNAASEKAREVMSFNSSTQLSNTQWSNLNEILLNPPTEATPELKALLKRRRTKDGSAI